LIVLSCYFIFDLKTKNDIIDYYKLIIAINKVETIKSQMLFIVIACSLALINNQCKKVGQFGKTRVELIDEFKFQHKMVIILAKH